MSSKSDLSLKKLIPDNGVSLQLEKWEQEAFGDVAYNPKIIREQKLLKDVFQSVGMTKERAEELDKEVAEKIKSRGYFTAKKLPKQ